jgi:hypothetical protein
MILVHQKKLQWHLIGLSSNSNVNNQTANQTANQTHTHQTKTKQRRLEVQGTRTT